MVRYVIAAVYRVEPRSDKYQRSIEVVITYYKGTSQLTASTSAYSSLIVGCLPHVREVVGSVPAPTKFRFIWRQLTQIKDCTTKKIDLAYESKLVIYFFLQMTNCIVL